ncbi:hypothetical protein Taro_047573 [Colocasia esculenta]|uniref:Uncharacterized protein n=1 Tax=Colocasia esculenta TaxID=4460 RepID=A0A843X421_COLES|nr:hypothetical protein [Colocasia esculenta]
MEGRRVVIAFGHPSSQVRNGNNTQETAELFSFGRLKEEKLKPSSPFAARVNSVNRRVNEVNLQPHHRKREFDGVCERPGDPEVGRGRRGNKTSTALFWRSRWDNTAAAVCVHPGCVLMDTWLDPVNMANKPAFEYDDNVNEIVDMINTNVQPEESVQSSSQADNEEVSLRVNPTHAQNAQEDPEFSKLMSRYSPDEIISMLSKHTIRAAASPSTPSLSPFNASTSRPTPRPVTSPRVPVSTFIPSPTPAPFPTPILTPPSAHSPLVQITRPTQSESIPRSEVEGLVRKLLAESLSLSKPHSLQNYCKLPNTYFPPDFKAPKYRKYDGTSDPQFHLAGFTMDSHRRREKIAPKLYQDILFFLSRVGTSRRGETGRPHADPLKEERENCTQASSRHPLLPLTSWDVQEGCFEARGALARSYNINNEDLHLPPSLFLNSLLLEQHAGDRGALLLWPAEGGEVEALVSIRCTRRPYWHDSNTPWAQSTQSTGGSTRSTGNPIIANESSAASVSVREIQRSARDGAETRRPQLFSGDHGGTTLLLRSVFIQVDDK